MTTATRMVSEEEFQQAEEFKTKLLELQPAAREMFYAMLRGALEVSRLYAQQDAQEQAKAV